MLGGLSVRIENLPLFPLRVVLFPGMMLPLHIFEDRYRQMIHDCLADDPRFGVSLITEGNEVGGPAKVCDVGAIARIINVGKYPGGEMDIMCVGLQRFRILDFHTDKPYLCATVETFADAAEARADMDDRVGAVRELLRSYLDRRQLTGDNVADLPQEAEALSYVPGVLDLPLDEKQRLLETDSTTTRLERIIRLLQHELGLMDQLGPTRPMHGYRRISPN